MSAAPLLVALRALPLVAFKCQTAQICVLRPLKVKICLHNSESEICDLRYYNKMALKQVN
jgi:hypothetical protein